MENYKHPFFLWDVTTHPFPSSRLNGTWLRCWSQSMNEKLDLIFIWWCTVHPKKYAHGFVVLCFVVVMQSFIMNSHEVFIHIHQGCCAGTGAIVRLPQCQWSKPDGYGKISQCITTTKHSKAKTVCIFLVIYCDYLSRSLSQFWCSFSLLVVLSMLFTAIHCVTYVHLYFEKL